MPNSKTAKSPARKASSGRKPAAKKPAASKSPAKPRKSESEPTTAESLTEFARKRPGLVVGGAIFAGLVVGALMPRGTGRKIVRGVASAAALSSEAGLTLARQAREKTLHAADEAGEQLRDLEGRASETARRIGRTTAAAAGTARHTALDLVRTGLNLLATLNR
jgi:hypothetical protein